MNIDIPCILPGVQYLEVDPTAKPQDQSTRFTCYNEDV